MKNRKHLIIGTILCATTMILFLIFYNQLPDKVPLQMQLDGTGGNYFPKQLVVFGLPIVFVLVNLIKNVSSLKEENTSIHTFYIIPGIAVILSVLTLLLALNLG